MIEIIKKFVKDGWNWLLGKTTVDEKAIAAVKEIKEASGGEALGVAADVSVELRDVAKAIKEVGNQVGDIDNALKGEERKGRKNGTKNK